MVDWTEDGDCFSVAGDLVLSPGTSLPDTAVLVHGRPTLARPPHVPYAHAWVEVDGVVLDLANGRNIQMDRASYYAGGKIKEEECFRYSRDEALDKLLHFKHWGPWEGPEAAPPNPYFEGEECDECGQTTITVNNVLHHAIYEYEDDDSDEDKIDHEQDADHAARIEVEDGEKDGI
jgi:hypothetical protein